jgi:hypothetical protein
VGGVIRNNLLYDNHASGISLYRIDAGGGASGNLVVNNTIVNAADGRWCLNIRDGSTGNVVRNNVLWNLHAFRGTISVDDASRPGFVSDYNSLMDRMSVDGGDTVLDLGAWQAEGHDAHSFVATPADHFLVPGTDFRLLATSPAVDAGTPLGAPAFDLDGAPRPVGAGIDLGSYERQLLECGDGGADPGEQCGEPGLGCTDACTTCVQCVCAVTDPSCGALCTSGIALAKPRLALRASPGRLKVRGEAVLPEPWTGVDPPANGLRVVVDSALDPGGIDVALPGGGAWSAGNRRWIYRDPAGAVGGVTKAVVQDRRHRVPGLVRVVVKGRGGSFTPPGPSAVRTTVVVGDSGECAAVAWNGPTGATPRCRGDASRLVCK